ncbi:hypothetical protein HF325_003604 [Metschnikowia pulcherrima]|uniref:Very-long-chain 3-oxoacyl-CoA reductase n=1 Tax=Metschnikowia pulcherrima TaxID=27326 RepID=A0A8H7LBT7_9ASCO|nr:hypothetical protein HF325_003604 [Metschnikowia pulcherrima]
MSVSDLINSITENKVGQAVLYTALLTGVYKLTTFTLSFGSLIADLFILPATNFRKYGAAKNDNWAVVTGASDGIGKEYAFPIGQKRTLLKLEALADEIKANSAVSTKVIAFDASIDDDNNYKAIKEAIADLHVTVLINNVGQSHSIPVPFLETESKELTDIVTINNLVTLKITQAVAPVIVKTVASQKREGVRGLILTMGSFGGLIPTPYLATYSGSKAFLQQWSSALAGELKPQGVDVQLVVSYLVTSAMSKIKRASATIPNPKQFVKATLNTVGKRCGAQERFATSTPYWSHAFMHFFIENSVGVYASLVNKLNLDMHKSIRVRALKKAARQKTE